MQVEIFSDVVCPWCAIGKRRFEAVLAGFAHAGEVGVRWRSFELDPQAPRRRDGPYAARLAAKYGISADEARAMIDRMTQTAAGEGLNFHFERAVPGNSFDAHRLLHLAADKGIQDAVKERFLTGYLSDGVAVGEPDELAALAVDAGLDADAVRAVLDGDAYADQVRADEREAMALGIRGVPFFVIDRRFGVSGAQPAEVLREALEQAWDTRSPLVTLGAGATDDGCADGSCEV